MRRQDIPDFSLLCAMFTDGQQSGRAELLYPGRNEMNAVQNSHALLATLTGRFRKQPQLLECGVVAGSDFLHLDSKV